MAESHTPLPRIEATKPAGFRANTFFTVGTLAIVVAGLAWASAVFLPIALSTLLTFMLVPAVQWLERRRVPRLPAVLLVLTGVAVVLTAMAFVTAVQLGEMEERLPRYRENAMCKIERIRYHIAPLVGRIEQLSTWMDRLERSGPSKGPSADLLKEAPTGQTKLPQSAKPPGERVLEEPLAEAVADSEASVPVRVIEKSFSISTFLTSWGGTLFAPLGMIAAVAVFVLFFLLQYDDLRSRLIVLLGIDRVGGTVQLLDEAGARVSIFLRMQFLVNAIYGLVVTAICFFAGLPAPFLWGFLGGMLRFAPYVGPFIAFVIPVSLAAVVTDQWTTALWVFGLLVVVELITNNVLETWFYGTSTGISPVGILISAVFWAWLWGGIGLVLATPLTVCVVVLGRHIPALRFIATMLEEGAPLTPSERIYERLLKDDTLAAERILEKELKGSESAATLSDVLLPVLARASAERDADSIDAAQFDQIARDTLELLHADLAGDVLPPEAEGSGKTARVICLPARDLADMAAARVAAAQLFRDGWEAVWSDKAWMANDLAVLVQQSGADQAVIAAVGANAKSRARYLARRIRAAGWTGPIAAFFPSAASVEESELALLKSGGIDAVYLTTDFLIGGLRGRREMGQAKRGETNRVPAPAMSRE